MIALHDHNNHRSGHDQYRNKNRAGLTLALIITAVIMLVEFFGGLITNSLALLSDSGHMLSDVSSLILSLAAVWFASKPPSPQKSYGYYRFEILAALFNGVTLFIIAGFIVWEAYGRLLEPPAVASGSMIIIAITGLLANAGSAFALLRKGDVKENINVRSAYIHILGDALGSLGAILAGILMLLFSWYIADPIISIIVALLILKSAWGIVNQTVHILMEGTPKSINILEVHQKLQNIQGVINAHDLHVWTITSGLHSLSCHLLINDNFDEQVILQEAINIIDHSFNIHHTTIQVEKSRFQHDETVIQGE